MKLKINKKILRQKIESLREYIMTASEYFKTNNRTKKEKIKANLINVLYFSIHYHIATHSSTIYDHQTKKYITTKETHEIFYRNDTGEILDSCEYTESYEHTELEK